MNILVFIMSLQIIKTKIPDETIFGLLERICLKNEKYYMLNYEFFKKGVFNNEIQTFLNMCKQHYYVSKYCYLEKKLTYKSFLTVLRQICKYNKITYTSEIKYDKSNYNIVYYIYHNIA